MTDTITHIDDNLTPREWEVLYWVAEGYMAKEVCQKLNITEATVKYHLSNVYSKLGASGRREAVRLVRERGMVPAIRIPGSNPFSVIAIPSENNIAYQKQYSSLHDITHREIWKIPDGLLWPEVSSENIYSWLRLTRRQRQVAILVWERPYVDDPARELAEVLQVAEGTIKKHLQRIYKKLNVSTRAGTVRVVEEVIQIVEHISKQHTVGIENKERGFT